MSTLFELHYVYSAHFQALYIYSSILHLKKTPQPLKLLSNFCLVFMLFENPKNLTLQMETEFHKKQYFLHPVKQQKRAAFLSAAPGLKEMWQTKEFNQNYSNTN